jgi:hypothetical protein
MLIQERHNGATSSVSARYIAFAIICYARRYRRVLPKFICIRVKRFTRQTKKSVLKIPHPAVSGSRKNSERLPANGADERPSETFAMSEQTQTFVTIARCLAAALEAAAAKNNAHDEPQQQISALEKQLIEAYRAELQEELRV